MYGAFLTDCLWLQWAQLEMGLPLLAVTCDRVAREWGGADGHVNFVCYYPEQQDAAGETVWGGIDAAGALVGGSVYYLDRQIGGALAGVLAIGGGEVSMKEVKYVLERDGSPVAPVAFIRAAPAKPFVVGGLETAARYVTLTLSSQFSPHSHLILI